MTTSGADVTPPTVWLVGPAALTLELGRDAYVELGATAVDDVDGEIVAAVVDYGGLPLDARNVPTAVGSYVVTYTATDVAANVQTLTRSVHVHDTTPPELVLNGPAVVEVQAAADAGATYEDAGATATDASWVGAQRVLAARGAVDLQTPGEYTLEYEATDAWGNVSEVLTRLVRVVDGAPSPQIALVGEAVVSCELGSAYVDAGATATDAAGDAVAVAVVADDVDTATAGSYVVWYEAADAAGLSTTVATRRVVVADTTPPQLVLNGDAVDEVDAHEGAYVDAGAAATDASWVGAQKVLATAGSVDVSTPGEYTLEYEVADASGNASQTLARLVRVAHATSPFITRNGGGALVTHELGEAYVDAGATAVDDAGEVVYVAVDASAVDVQQVGSYVVRYAATDAAGNASSRTRVVEVVDTTGPQLWLNGDAADQHAQLALDELETYLDIGATAIDASWSSSRLVPLETGHVEVRRRGVDAGAPLATVRSSASVVQDMRAQLRALGVGTYELRYFAADASGNDSAAAGGGGVPARTLTLYDPAAPARAFFYDRPALKSAVDRWFGVNGVAQDRAGLGTSLAAWDVSAVQDFSGLFQTHFAEVPNAEWDGIGEWDMSSARDLRFMFDGCLTFDQPIGGWDVSRVVSMRSMFRACVAFNQPLAEWDVGSVRTLSGLFDHCERFNQRVDAWDVSRVTTFSVMFRGCVAFNQPFVDARWDMRSAIDVYGMFEGCSSFNRPVSAFGRTLTREKLYRVARAFRNAAAFDQPVGDWDVAGVRRFDGMFEGCKSFDRDISGWDLSGAHDLSRMFRGALSFDRDLSAWATYLASRATTLVLDDVFANALGMSGQNLNQIEQAWGMSVVREAAISHGAISCTRITAGMLVLGETKITGIETALTESNAASTNPVSRGAVHAAMQQLEPPTDPGFSVELLLRPEDASSGAALPSGATVLFGTWTTAMNTFAAAAEAPTAALVLAGAAAAGVRVPADGTYAVSASVRAFVGANAVHASVRATDPAAPADAAPASLADARAPSAAHPNGFFNLQKDAEVTLVMVEGASVAQARLAVVLVREH